MGQDVIEHGYGIEAGPLFGSSRLSSGSTVIGAGLERQDSLEMGVPGYGIGLIYTSRVNKIGFTTGLRYLQTGYQVAEQPVDQSGSERTFTQRASARYLSVPFELNFYQDIKPQDRVFFTLGAAAHFHLGTRVTQTNLVGGEAQGDVVLENDPDQPFRSPIISLNTSMGFDRKFSERWSMRIEPFFQFFLQSNLRDAVDQTNRNYFQVGARVLVRRAIF